MRNLWKAALVAALLAGCTGAPDEKKAAVAQTSAATERTVLAPAPPLVPLVPLVVATDACTDRWLSDYAKEHNISIAEAGRRARNMNTDQTSRVTVDGKSVPFVSTVWFACETNIIATRAAQVAATARAVEAAPATPTVSQADYDKLIVENKGVRSERNTLLVLCIALLCVIAGLTILLVRKAVSKETVRPVVRSAPPPPVRTPSTGPAPSQLGAFSDEDAAAEEPSRDGFPEPRRE